MKKLTLLCLAFTLFSCSSKKEKETGSGIFVERQLKDFVALYPNWTKDEATEKETTEKFRHKLINLSNETDFLKNMPLQLKEVKDTLIQNEPIKLAVFRAYGDKKRSETSMLNYMQLQIWGIVSDAQLKKLAVDSNYVLTGSLYKQGKRADVKFIHVADFRGYDLGKYTFLITGFTPL